MTSPSRIYSTSIYLGWSVVIAFGAVVSGITLSCHLTERQCERTAIDSLWSDVVVGVFALVAASAPGLVLHHQDVSKDNQTSEKQEL